MRNKNAKIKETSLLEAAILSTDLSVETGNLIGRGEIVRPTRGVFTFQGGEIDDTGIGKIYLDALQRSHQGQDESDPRDSSQCSTGFAYPWEDGEAMGVLVLRGASFVGFHVTKQLLEEGHKVTIVDSFDGNTLLDSGALHSKQLRTNELRKMRSRNLRIIDGDPCDLIPLRKFLKKHEFSHILYIPEELHVAKNPTRAVNETLLCISKVLERLKLHSHVHFTLLSSLSAHHVENTIPESFKKSHSLTQHNYMTLLQNSMENILEFYHFLYQLPITRIRLGQVIGEWMDLSDPVMFLLEKTLHKESVDKTFDLSDGEFAPSIYYTNQSISHIKDVVYVLMKVMQQRFYCEYFDLGARNPSSLEDLHRHMIRESKQLKSPVHILDHQQGSVLDYFGIYHPIHRVVHYIPCQHKSHIEAVLPEWSVTLKEATRQLVQWYEALHLSILPNGAQDKIFTSYFTSSKDPQRKVKMRDNNFDYIKVWYFSLLENNLEAVIFHDGLSEDFTSRLTSDNLQFQYATLNNRSTNDARFYIYYNYLMEHPEVQRVILTDVSDVQFLRNPFSFMDLLGNMLYIGTDISMFPTMNSMGWLRKRMPECFGSDSVDRGEVAGVKNYLTVYNAGVIGGTRSIMLEFLAQVIMKLDKTPFNLNCNMPVVNFVVHRYFDTRVHTGYPLTSEFYRRQADPRVTKRVVLAANTTRLVTTTSFGYYDFVWLLQLRLVTTTSFGYYNFVWLLFVWLLQLRLVTTTSFGYYDFVWLLRLRLVTTTSC
ncbi:hypothetical protein CAPTEDRAFT_217035 [Capitella teleta]|uniref:NAD-dependent epimerase/dehydratase domain-containing protein n=1 Tax=Capitella teleta TaxID=283909 RepID=R7URD9_CAPTE|nr:hypothetical protein CAPTEDRAFT_217035 [Capitella teleta]|eukprot:ELU08760.1 hypothetical protein CAPTEDRAFT_217035 [Capitella teleta]